MKWLRVLYIVCLITLMATAASAALIEVQIPLKTTYNSDENTNYTNVKILSNRTSAVFREWSIADNTSGEEVWTLYYPFESAEICPQYEADMQVYNWSETFYNMTNSLDMMITAFNDSSNLSQEVILAAEIREELGKCKGTAEDYYNRTLTLESENEMMQSSIANLKGFENNYATCASDLAKTKDNLTTRLMMGIAIGIGGYHFLFKPKKMRPEEADQEEFGDYGNG